MGWVRWAQALVFLLPLPLTLLAGCATWATQGLAGGVSEAMLNQEDPALVREGAPAYLLLIDGQIRQAPDNAKLLIDGAQLYSAYAGAFVEEPERSRALTERAREYARRAICIDHPKICEADRGPYRAFVAQLQQIGRKSVPELYTYAAAWAGWLQARSEEFAAMAELPKVHAMMERVVQLDESHQHGRAHLYLAVMDSLAPAQLGGRPERGQEHFRQAIRLSKGRDLLAKVEYARRYARLTFDRALFEQLLEEVVAADPVVPGLTLSNVLAQQQAQSLLAQEEQFFPE